MYKTSRFRQVIISVNEYHPNTFLKGVQWKEDVCHH